MGILTDVEATALLTMIKESQEQVKSSALVKEAEAPKDKLPDFLKDKPEDKVDDKKEDKKEDKEPGKDKKDDKLPAPEDKKAPEKLEDKDKKDEPEGKDKLPTGAPVDKDMELRKELEGLPPKAQDVWLKVYHIVENFAKGESEFKESAEECAEEVAWSVIEDFYAEKGEKWEPKKSSWLKQADDPMAYKPGEPDFISLEELQRLEEAQEMAGKKITAPLDIEEETLTFELEPSLQGQEDALKDAGIDVDLVGLIERVDEEGNFDAPEALEHVKDTIKEEYPDLSAEQQSAVFDAVLTGLGVEMISASEKKASKSNGKRVSRMSSWLRKAWNIGDKVKEKATGGWGTVTNLKGEKEHEIIEYVDEAGIHHETPAEALDWYDAAGQEKKSMAYAKWLKADTKQTEQGVSGLDTKDPGQPKDGMPVVGQPTSTETPTVDVYHEEKVDDKYKLDSEKMWEQLAKDTEKALKPVITHGEDTEKPEIYAKSSIDRKARLDRIKAKLQAIKKKAAGTPTQTEEGVKGLDTKAPSQPKDGLPVVNQPVGKDDSVAKDFLDKADTPAEQALSSHKDVEQLARETDRELSKVENTGQDKIEPMIYKDASISLVAQEEGWKALYKEVAGDKSKCMAKMKGEVKDEAAFCTWLFETAKAKGW